MRQIIFGTRRPGVVALVLAGSLAAVGVASAADGPTPRVRPCPSSAGKAPIPDRTRASCELTAAAESQAANQAAGRAAATVVRTGSDGSGGDTATGLAILVVVLFLAVGSGTAIATHRRRATPEPQP